MSTIKVFVPRDSAALAVGADEVAEEVEKRHPSWVVFFFGGDIAGTLRFAGINFHGT